MGRGGRPLRVPSCTLRAYIRSTEVARCVRTYADLKLPRGYCEVVSGFIGKGGCPLRAPTCPFRAYIRWTDAACGFCEVFMVSWAGAVARSARPVTLCVRTYAELRLSVACVQMLKLSCLWLLRSRGWIHGQGRLPTLRAKLPVTCLHTLN